MKKRIILAIVFLLTLVKVSAEDMVTIKDFSISAGETKEMIITLDNDVSYVGFQFDLYLPEGITLTEFSANKTRIPESATLTMTKRENGCYRFLAAAMDLKEIKGTSGSIITIKVAANENMESGNLTGSFQKVKLSKTDGTGTTYAEMSFPITILAPSTVTAKSYERTYGEANPIFDFDVEGGALDGVPEIICEATESSPIGNYDIIIKRGTETNLNVTYIKGTLTITKAPLTITAKDYTVKQGEALPTFEATYEGFKNSETSDVLTKQPSFTTTATSDSNLGEYVISVSGAEAQNYDIIHVRGKLTIVKADALIITANSYTIEYGDEIPAFEYTSDGTTLSGTPSITCEAKKGSPAGTYDIVISKGSVTNYNDTYVNGKLTITKAPLTITAKDYTIKQGEALPTFEATYEGFKNNETKDVLTKQPTITTMATSTNAIGDYVINVYGAESQNYEITYVRGKLTIVDADALVITANSYTIEYGDEIPVFEYTSEGASIEGTPTITCEAKKGSPAGTYDIIISKGSVTNYNDTYINGKLIITKAPLTITAKDYTIKQGETLPTFEATYEGFKNGETKDVLTKQPTITTTATSGSAIGDYVISVSGAESQNYEIIYVKGKLTIAAVEVITPVTEDEEVSFNEQINEGADLSDTVIENTYFTLDADKGDGYDAEEKAIVLNSTTTEEQMKVVQEAKVGDKTVQEEYFGVIFEIAPGSGTVTVDAKTIGKHALNVRIGKAEPTKVTSKERSTADISFSVNEPTYVYLYASSEGADAARAQRAPSAAENSVLLYGYKVTLDEPELGDANGDGKVDAADIADIVNHTIGKPTSTGKFIEAAADVNGDGTVNAADIVQIVNMIMGK